MPNSGKSLNRLLAILLLIFATGVCGCAKLRTGKTVNYRTVVESGSHDTETAEKRHNRAMDLLCDCDVCGAEQLLHKALLADVSFGPAHNTLGKVYFDQEKFYLAAWEFEYANRLMPNRGEPLNNLGLVYEAVGQTDKAITYYEQARVTAPDSPEYLGNYVRARIRRGDRTIDLRPLLESLVLIEDRREWADWARGRLVLGKIDEPAVCNFSSYGDAEPEFVPSDGEFTDTENEYTPAPLEFEIDDQDYFRSELRASEKESGGVFLPEQSVRPGN